MDTSNLINDLKRDEGLRLKAYQDTLGVWTIGYGYNLQEMEITEAEAEKLLVQKVTEVYQDLDRNIPWWRDLDQDQQDGLANMAYNLGITKLLKFKYMLAALRVGDLIGVRRECMNSRWYWQVGKRAERIIKKLAKEA